MKFPRSSGVLLHPTSLPGRFGIGDLGPAAHEFVSFLAESGQRWWQVLPLGPTGGMNSPYQSDSSFAGNPLLISPEAMVECGWLDRGELDDHPGFPAEQVDFPAVAQFKHALLHRACERFDRDDAKFQEFLSSSAHWLDDYALFAAIKDASGEKAWFQWEPDLVRRKPPALSRRRHTLEAGVHFHQFVQYVFEIQMQALRKTCAERAVNLIGDIPIFVAHDSADVWARPDLFHLDARGRLTVQAGVPPDLFSNTGQLWGNPLYRWEAHEQEGFAWWIERLSALLRWVDLIRIDHFRGLQAYWEVPGRARTAARGRWVEAPGDAFLKALHQHFVDLPLIAEDLGVITPEVEALRDAFGLPGMRVLQFGFTVGLEEQSHLPHRFVPHCIVYTGTHDNDTAMGWLNDQKIRTTQSAAQIRAERSYALRYLGSSGKQFNWDLIRLAQGSVAEVAIIPMQDLLGLGSQARMNVPGKAEGNWGWRFRRPQLTTRIMDRLADLTAVCSRWNGPTPDDLNPRHVPDDSESIPTPKELGQKGEKLKIEPANDGGSKPGEDGSPGRTRKQPHGDSPRKAKRARSSKDGSR